MQDLGDVDGRKFTLGVETSTAPHRTAGAWLGEGGSSRTGSLLAPRGRLLILLRLAHVNLPAHADRRRTPASGTRAPSVPACAREPSTALISCFRFVNVSQEMAACGGSFYLAFSCCIQRCACRGIWIYHGARSLLVSCDCLSAFGIAAGILYLPHATLPRYSKRWRRRTPLHHYLAQPALLDPDQPVLY
jgi:hypothetical protein